VITGSPRFQGKTCACRQASLSIRAEWPSRLGGLSKKALIYLSTNGKKGARSSAFQLLRSVPAHVGRHLVILALMREAGAEHLPLHGSSELSSLCGNYKLLLDWRFSESTEEIQVEQFLAHDVQEHPEVPGEHQSHS
jgi:hypothetical protein